MIAGYKPRKTAGSAKRSRRREWEEQRAMVEKAMEARAERVRLAKEGVQDPEETTDA